MDIKSKISWESLKANKKIIGVTLFCTLFMSILFFIFNSTQDEVSSVPASVSSDTDVSIPVAVDTTLTPEIEVALQEEITPLIKAGDMSACQNIQNEMYKKVCINNIALNKAYETKDISYCQYLDNELIPRADCERKIIFEKSITEESITACSEASDEALRLECENGYYFGLATKNNDPSICTKAADAGYCTDSYWLQQFMIDPSKVSCTSFSKDDVRNDCAKIKSLASSNFSNKDDFMKVCQTQKTDFFSMACNQLLNMR